jgi:hypothetical protein
LPRCCPRKITDEPKDQTMTTIRRPERETAVYQRPEWMSDEQWQHVSAEMTEQWLILLEEQARRTNPAASRTAS